MPTVALLNQTGEKLNDMTQNEFNTLTIHLSKQHIKS